MWFGGGDCFFAISVQHMMKFGGGRRSVGFLCWGVGGGGGEMGVLASQQVTGGGVYTASHLLSPDVVRPPTQYNDTH